jgi:adenylate cyclase
MLIEATELRSLFQLQRDVDEMVEQALRDRCSLVRAMERILPEVCARLAVRGVFLRTFSEDMAMATFSSSPELSHPLIDAFVRDNAEHNDLRGVFRAEGAALAAQGLDVAGEWFGSAGLLLAADEGRPESFLVAALEVVCEQIDNYLHGIRAAREKQRTMMALARALRNRVLADGLADAVEVLAGAVALERLLLVVLADDSDEAPVHVQVYEGSVRTVDTMGLIKPDAEAELQREARMYLATGDQSLLQRFGFEGAREEVLITGVKDTLLVGKVLVASKTGDFDTYDRDLLSGFSTFICQRVVDFSKEYKMLARSFRPQDVTRMLRTSDYVERYLEPREGMVAIVFADLSRFTRVSEQILIDPKRISHLVDVWGGAAVDLVWEHGGVFDKMVGDCIIGLFGPPFFDSAPGDYLTQAVRAAMAIRAMTNALPQTPGFEALRDEGLGASIGVNLAPLFVGRFGPNENFTGFSSGMNNTARLQGMASRNEILLMEDACEALPAGNTFQLSEARSAAAKNVAKPLRFRAILG